MFNTPSNECWRFTIKPQICLLLHKRTKIIRRCYCRWQRVRGRYCSV